MKSSAIKTSFRLLAVLFLMSTVFGGCAGMQLKSEVASVPEGRLRIIITNDADILLYHCTYWVNHNILDFYGRSMKCCAELKPGANQTFNMNILQEAFRGTRLYHTDWYPYNDDLLEKYRSRVVSEIPEGTAIIKIYHRHFEAIPR